MKTNIEPITIGQDHISALAAELGKIPNSHPAATCAARLRRYLADSRKNQPHHLHAAYRAALHAKSDSAWRDKALAVFDALMSASERDKAVNDGCPKLA